MFSCVEYATWSSVTVTGSRKSLMTEAKYHFANGKYCVCRTYRRNDIAATTISPLSACLPYSNLYSTNTRYPKSRSLQVEPYSSVRMSTTVLRMYGNCEMLELLRLYSTVKYCTTFLNSYLWEVSSKAQCRVDLPVHAFTSFCLFIHGRPLTVKQDCVTGITEYLTSII